jgi:Tfp pilus assembly protein PilF
MNKKNLLILIVLFLISSCQNKSDDLRTKAYDLFIKKDYASAIPIFEEVLKSDPTNLDSRLRYGNSLEEVGKIEDAIEEYKKLLKEKDNHLLGLISLANAYRKVEEIDLAVKTMEKAISLKPKEAWMLDNFGNILEQAKDFDKAYDQYRKAVEIEPYDPEYRIDLANICLKIKKTPCIKLDRDISTLDLYKDIRDEALDQINMLSEQEKSAETDKQKQKFTEDKEPYVKRYNFANDMASLLEKE